MLVFKVGAGVNMSKFKLKLVHFLLQLTAFTLSVLALIAVFKFHRNHGYPNMISLHNWIGLTTVIFFGLQVGISLERLYNEMLTAYGAWSCWTAIIGAIIGVGVRHSSGGLIQFLPEFPGTSRIPT